MAPSSSRRPGRAARDMSDGMFGDSDEYDAAFGPNLGSFGAGAPDETVRQGQALLNALGYGPIAVDGIYGPETGEALAQFYNARKQSSPNGIDSSVLSALVQAAKVAGVTPGSGLAPSGASGSSSLPVTAGGQGLAPAPADVPIWKKPALWVGVGVVSVIGYFLWRSSQEEALKGLGEGESEPKCGRTPEWSSGKPIGDAAREVPAPLSPITE
ncbi:MAG: peptidoglycan-binding protein [Patescibacteria group bacterium]|nr:peptidoglycan-binding protein [Patescibacteria group bacterium]